MYPRTAQVNRPAIKVNGVEPPADSVSCLQDDTIDFRLTQGVGNRQPGNPRAYHHDPLYRPDDPAGDIVAPAVEQPFSHAHPRLPRDAEHLQSHAGRSQPRLRSAHRYDSKRPAMSPTRLGAEMDPFGAMATAHRQTARCLGLPYSPQPS